MGDELAEFSRCGVALLHMVFADALLHVIHRAKRIQRQNCAKVLPADINAGDIEQIPLLLYHHDVRIQVFPLLERLEHSTGQRQARQFREALADQLRLCAVERVFRNRVCNFNHAVGIQLQNGIKGVVQ